MPWCKMPVGFSQLSPPFPAKAINQSIKSPNHRIIESSNPRAVEHQATPVRSPEFNPDRPINDTSELVNVLLHVTYSHFSSSRDSIMCFPIRSHSFFPVFTNSPRTRSPRTSRSRAYHSHRRSGSVPLVIPLSGTSVLKTKGKRHGRPCRPHSGRGSRRRTRGSVGAGASSGPRSRAQLLHLGSSLRALSASSWVVRLAFDTWVDRRHRKAPQLGHRNFLA